jgi:hypothetical protein
MKNMTTRATAGAAKWTRPVIAAENPTRRSLIAYHPLRHRAEIAQNRSFSVQTTR